MADYSAQQVLYDPYNPQTSLSNSFSKENKGSYHNSPTIIDVTDNPEYPFIGKGSPSDFSITTGWSWPLRWLLLHGIVSILWGIALCIFATGVVPIAWAISEVAQNYPETTNTVVALAAATATTHISYILQEVLEQYSHVVVVDGFTLGELRWMQGVKEMSIFTRFPRRKAGGRLVFWSKKRLLWVFVYAGFLFHTASLVAILQPELFFVNEPFNDEVPCGKDLGQLTLDVDTSVLNETQQQTLDSFSFNLGLSLATYGEQVNSNTTNSFGGRIYVKDAYAYGAVGGLQNGLQEIPGAAFSGLCSNSTLNPTSVWQATFPERSPPTVTTFPNGSRQFSDTDIPSEMRQVVSHATPFNTSGDGWAAMYALVDPSGSGAYAGIQWTPQGENMLVCSWKAAPKIVHVQTVNFTAQTLGSDDSDKYPDIIGRATWSTLRGMADATRMYGASLYTTSRSPYDELVRGQITGFGLNSSRKPIAQVLETLLADGCKASMSIFNHYVWVLYRERKDSGPGCNSRNRTLSPHWRFHNSKNLGWAAVVWTTGIGIFGVCTAVWASKKKRMQSVSLLAVADAFVLGRQDEIPDLQALCVRDGRIVEAY